VLSVLTVTVLVGHRLRLIPDLDYVTVRDKPVSGTQF
jgi:hypothetical protein